MKLVRVDWVDSHFVPGWESGHEAACRPVKVRSVGWLLKKTRHGVVLSSNIVDGEESQHCGAMTIPAAAVRRVRVIKER